MKCARCGLDKKHYNKDWPVWAHTETGYDLCGFCIEDLPEIGIDFNTWSPKDDRETEAYANSILAKRDRLILEHGIDIDDSVGGELITDVGNCTGRKKIPQDIVCSIRQDYRTMRIAQLIEKYGYSSSTIGDIVKGRRAYAHLEPAIKDWRNDQSVRRALTEKQVEEIRAKKPTMSYAALAEEYGCSTGVLLEVIKRRGAYADK